MYALKTDCKAIVKDIVGGSIVTHNVSQYFIIQIRPFNNDHQW